MKFFIDTANPDEIKRAYEMGVIEQLVKHLLTDIGIERFLADWKKVPKK